MLDVNYIFIDITVFVAQTYCDDQVSFEIRKMTDPHVRLRTYNRVLNE